LTTGSGRFIPPAVPLHTLDLRSPRLGQVFAAERPEAVIHLAAQASVSRSVSDPALDAQVNLLGGINVLERAARAGTRRLVYASSGGAAYADTAPLPAAESAPVAPKSPYGASKVAFETYLDVWRELHGLSALALRLANVYGPRQDPRGEAGVVAIFCHRLLSGEPPVINGDGEQTRDYVYVEDVAAAFLAALERPEATGCANVGTGIETSVNALHGALCRAAGRRVEAEHGPARPGEQRRSCLHPGRARDLLGWTPRVALEDGLARTWDFFTGEASP
ncbi:MAG TPA: NAD-dependent epimerase/dehydratase family protein, partial [Vicinamibacteria bacterium]